MFHHAGGGHQSGTEAFKGTSPLARTSWQVTLLDIQELLDPLDLIRRATGIRIQDTYNLILRRGWTRFSAQLLVVLQATIRLYHSSIVKLLQNYWSQHSADVVVSVIPHFNREIAESLRSAESEDAVRHSNYRSGRLSAALLDRARVGIHNRGHGARAATGLSDGTR